MSRPALLTHQLEGLLVAYDVSGLMKAVLITEPDAASITRQLQADGAQWIGQGTLTLRLGMALYDRPFLFVPYMIIDEVGRSVNGEALFDWLRRMAYEMPRSEVFGIDARGKEGQVFARDVDVESSPIVVGGSETSPVYVVCMIGAARLPPRFASALKTRTAAQLPEIRTIIESA